MPTRLSCPVCEAICVAAVLVDRPAQAVTDTRSRPPCSHSLVAIGWRSWWEILTMTGPRPAGRPWTAAEEAQLSILLASGMKVGYIARKLKRSPGAIYARINSVRKTPRDLAFAAQR